MDEAIRNKVVLGCRAFSTPAVAPPWSVATLLPRPRGPVPWEGSSSRMGKGECRGGTRGSGNGSAVDPGVWGLRRSLCHRLQWPHAGGAVWRPSFLPMSLTHPCVLPVPCPCPMPRSLLPLISGWELFHPIFSPQPCESRVLPQAHRGPQAGCHHPPGRPQPELGDTTNTTAPAALLSPPWGLQPPAPAHPG